jgi:hypothetical protein
MRIYAKNKETCYTEARFSQKTETTENRSRKSEEDLREGKAKRQKKHTPLKA